MHVDLVFWFVAFTEFSAAEEPNGIEMRNNGYFVVGLAILHKNLFHFPCSVPNILCCLSHILSVHELRNTICLLMIVIALNFFQKLEVSLLIL